jgi:hypothetical protein
MSLLGLNVLLVHCVYFTLSIRIYPFIYSVCSSISLRIGDHRVRDTPPASEGCATLGGLLENSLTSPSIHGLIFGIILAGVDKRRTIIGQVKQSIVNVQDI